MKEVLREARKKGVNVVNNTVNCLLSDGSRCDGAKTAKTGFVADMALLSPVADCQSSNNSNHLK
jgi:hypothetical protein